MTTKLSPDDRQTAGRVLRARGYQNPAAMLDMLEEHGVFTTEGGAAMMRVAGDNKRGETLPIGEGIARHVERYSEHLGEYRDPPPRSPPRASPNARAAKQGSMHRNEVDPREVLSRVLDHDQGDDIFSAIVADAFGGGAEGE